ncbi:DUF21 domain-containing protein [Anaerobacillus sp. HL2]|nr:DUF21 domain-containing protein [Anaerobacillus sp. HL2]
MPERNDYLTSVVMTSLVLVFGRFLPKSYAKENAERFALKYLGFF